LPAASTCDMTYNIEFLWAAVPSATRERSNATSPSQPKRKFVPERGAPFTSPRAGS